MKLFIEESKKEKKATIFVYHPSAYTQNYCFDTKPSIVLSTKQFLEYQDQLPTGVEYTVIPLLLSEGYFYKKLVKESKLKIEKPLLTTEEDINRLISLCRKEGCKNIWVLHPNGFTSLKEKLMEKLPGVDEVKNVEEELVFHKEGKTHVVILLMSEGQHYHDLMNQIPAHVSVSKILPLEEKIKEWIEKKEEN